MRVLIDIGHPAHVHLFRYFAQEMTERGHDIHFTCRDKEFEVYLLESFGLSYSSFGRKPSSIIGKVLSLAKYDILEILESLKFKPDIFLSHGSSYAAHAAFVMGKPNIALEDTFNFEQIWLYKSFSHAILTASYKHPLKSKNLVKYDGYHELAYLHPNYYQPDDSVLQDLGVEHGEKYIICRFVAWKASHDIGHKGVSIENKIKAVQEFSKYGKVFISSEEELPKELSGYQIKIPPHKLHDALYYASLVWGESFTVPAECSILGTPSIINHNTTSFYLKEQEKDYGLCFKYSESEKDQERAISKGVELLKKDSLKSEWKVKREKLLEEKIDLTAFLVWFIEHFPMSKRVMLENPTYQDRFKGIKNLV